MTLVDFLTAQLDADEAAARAATPGPWTPCVFEVGPSMFGVMAPNRDSPLVPIELEEADATHIARHDPARVLADVAAKRAIVELHEPWGFEYAGGEGCRRCVSPDDWTIAALPDEERYPCRTLRLLAQPYAGAPGWDEGWAA